MSKKTVSLAALALSLLLAACAEENRYPVSGDECKASDPVLGLNAANCTPPVAPPG